MFKKCLCFFLCIFSSCFCTGIDFAVECKTGKRIIKDWNTLKFSVDQICEITDGKLLFVTDKFGLYSISTDTRTINSDNVYLPLKGANFDGHNFIKTAVENNCAGFLLAKDFDGDIEEYKKSGFAIHVEDTLTAYLKLANYYRKKVNPTVVAITGSSGKTTTKEMVYSILSKYYKTHKSKLNHNNEIGLCQTLLTMPEYTQYLVVEMGMRGFGEIELLSKYAEPEIAVITNIGPAHIGRLGSIENITKAKAEIVSNLNKKGTLVAFDDELIKSELKNTGWIGKAIFYRSQEIIENNKAVFSQDGCTFEYENHQYELNITGEYNISNSIAAIEVGKMAELTPEKIKNGLLDYQPIENREQKEELHNGLVVINDSYNANPDSVKESIKSVVSSYKDKKIKIVLGDMAELGDREEFYHKQVGEFLVDKSIKELITVGEKAKIIADSLKSKTIKIKSFSDSDSAIEHIINSKEDDSVLLLKASRCMEFDKMAKGIIERVRGI